MVLVPKFEARKVAPLYIPLIHSNTLKQSKLHLIKKRSKLCLRCGEPFITDMHTQAYCMTCRGWMGSIKPSNLDTWNHGMQIRPLLEDMRR